MSKDKFIGLTIDSREPMDKFKDAYQYYIEHSKEGDKFPDIKYEALPYGDYLIVTKHHELLIERKEFHDYVNSIGDYLKERLEHMRNENQNTMLLIEGYPVYFTQHNNYIMKGGNKAERSLPYQTTCNFKLSQQLNGSMIFQTKDVKETVLALICFWRYLDNLPENKKSYHCKTWKKWLSIAPFVGKNLAEKVNQKYASCYEALLDIDDWANEKTLMGIMENWK